MDSGLSTVANVLTTLGDVITAVIGWMGDVLEFIVTNPIILVPMLMFFVTGGVIGLILRIMRG